MFTDQSGCVRLFTLPIWAIFQTSILPADFVASSFSSTASLNISAVFPFLYGGKAQIEVGRS